jgi:hypothetical protein
LNFYFHYLGVIVIWVFLSLNNELPSNLPSESIIASYYEKSEVGILKDNNLNRLISGFSMILSFIGIAIIRLKTATNKS